MKTVALAALALCPAPAFAQIAPAGPPSALPVREVTLFTSGVSYTERGGSVSGDAAVPLLFRTAQINDILKSLVLLDQQGQVQPATYAARDPIGHTLQSFAVDVTQNLNIQQILGRLRGAKVSVDVGGKSVLTGQIVGIEERQIAAEDNKPPVMASFLNLLTDSGLTSVKLDTQTTVKLLDERLDRELREALGLLASGSDEQRRQVVLHFKGAGTREVRVGYVTEAPLWKMSYRLLVGGATKGEAGKPYLQGWALVENTTDEDWTNIRLALVSGRPVSFIQDLYQPLYIPRPVVAPDVIASPYPQTHAGNMEQDARQLAELAKPPETVTRNGPPVAAPAKPDASLATETLDMGRMAARSRTAGGGGVAGMLANGNRGESAGASMDYFRQSVASQASGQSAGELFAYNISQTVTLPRQQAAMIPVVAQDIQAEKLSLYNADTDTRYPLNAVRIINTTDLHLKGGPITLFDAGVYAGDAKMEDIPPKDNRLVSYAVDLSIEAERRSPNAKMTETSLSLKRGVLTVTRKERQETTYSFKSKADKERTLLVEHPFRSDYKLVTPEKAEERTPGLYRFRVTVAPRKTEKLLVVTERPIFQTVAILDVELDALGVYANRKDISAKLKETLQEVVQRRRRVAELESQAAGKDEEIKSMGADQERIRKNMGALDRASSLYKRYVTELDNQETRLQALRQEAARLRNQSAAAERDLRAFVDGIVITE